MRDLFGEVPVSLDELLAWMLAVPGIPPSSPRFVYYLRFWDVIDKVRQAKIAGTFDELTRPRAIAPPYRLAAAIDAAELERHARRGR